jgi:hypothetical protein
VLTPIEQPATRVLHSRYCQVDSVSGSVWKVNSKVLPTPFLPDASAFFVTCSQMQCQGVTSLRCSEKDDRSVTKSFDHPNDVCVERDRAIVIRDEKVDVPDTD